MLLIVLYDGGMLVWMTKTIRDNYTRHYQYCISGARNNILSNGNHKNDNNTTASFIMIMNVGYDE